MKNSVSRTPRRVSPVYLYPFIFLSVYYFLIHAGFQPYIPLLIFSFTFLVASSLLLSIDAESIDNMPLANKLIIYFALYNIAILGISVYLSESLTHQKEFLYNLPSFVLPFSVILFSNNTRIQQWFKVSLLVWISIFLVTTIYSILEGTPYFTNEYYYLSFVFLIFPFLSKRNVTVYSVLIILLCLDNLQARAFLIVCLSSIVIYVASRKLKHFLPVIAYISIITPIAFALFALIFNINLIEELTTHLGETDTRTFLYEEIMRHLCEHNAYLFGTPGIGYKSSLVNVSYMSDSGEFLDFSELLWNGRLHVEVGILALLLHGGIINVVLITLIYWLTVKHTFNASKNDYCKYIATLLAFRYSFMYIEGLVQMFDQHLVVWMMFAICNNRKMLACTNEEMRSMFYFNKLKIRNLL